MLLGVRAKPGRAPAEREVEILQFSPLWSPVATNNLLKVEELEGAVGEAIGVVVTVGVGRIEGVVVAVGVTSAVGAEVALGVRVMVGVERVAGVGEGEGIGVREGAGVFWVTGGLPASSAARSPLFHRA
jgi:hypothetical protein